MSKFVEWSNDLSVGILEIDAQHQILVDLLNEIHDAIREGRTQEATREILFRLDEYTRIHFAVEECLMRVLSYPEYEQHKDDHDRLIVQLNDLHEKVTKGKVSIGYELAFFLKGWVTKHILDEDKRYAKHFLAYGLKAKAESNTSWSQRVWKLFGSR